MIRRLAPDDWELFRDIRLAALTDSPAAFGSTLASNQQYTEQIWRSRLTTAAYFSAAHETRLVGIAGGLPTQTAGLALLISMWVAPEARRLGIGEALVQRVAQWARDERFDRLNLWVTIGNTPAEQLYRRCGFTFTGKTEPVDADRTDAQEAEMELVL